MDPFSIRDAWPSVALTRRIRGDGLVPIVIGVVGISVSLATSPDLRGAFGAALAVLMLAIAVSDLQRFVVPDLLTAIAFVLGLIYAACFDVGSMAEILLDRLLRSTATALPFLALMLLYEWWRRRPGLGLGDVKLAAVAGVWLDWFSFVAVIEVAALTALAAFGISRYILRRPIGATTPLPFGLFLAPAIWAGWIGQILLLSP
jgi:leader peptidase (prepilin peptidase)/N-methyltransferase